MSHEDTTRDLLSERGANDRAAIIRSATPSARLQAGDQVGRYTIVGTIGAGGMGTVFEAEQKSPRRTVALKIIRAGFASQQTVRRFQHEAEVLGRLQHPGIAQIFEAGTFDSGQDPQPFFAMELIRGAPLTEFADREHLDTRQRLELVATVCDGAHHAHQRGVIHRDLKPGNIIVDDRGQPKILDFGVARATDSDIQTTTLQTSVGQLIGTVPYMSPEQAAGDPKELDTRSDVYALGVIAFELLARRLPHQFEGKTIYEAVRIIREDDPTPLSLVDRTFRGDIETIIGKALGKDKARRYQSAAALAEDIRRYLSHEPIAARPPSTLYQLRRFSQRNKALVGGAAAVFVALMAGVVVSTLQAVRATRAEGLAAEQAAIAGAVNDFLNRDLLARADPWVSPDREITVRTALDRAAERIEGKFEGEPLVEASIRTTIGTAYRGLGEYEPAERHLKRAYELYKSKVPEEDPNWLASVVNLAGLYRYRGQYDVAEPMLVKAMETSRRVMGGEDPTTLALMSELGALMRVLGRYDEAEPLWLDVLEVRRRSLGEDNEDTLQAMNNVADLYVHQSRYDEAEPLLVGSVEICRRLLGEEHPGTLVAMHNLTWQYIDQGRYSEAQPLVEETLKLRRRVLGVEHPDTLLSVNSLAVLYERQGRFEDAEALHAETLEIRRRLLGPEHIDTLISINNLAVVYKYLRRYEDAERLFLEVLRIQRRVLGEEHPNTLGAMNNLAGLYRDQGRCENAEPLYAEAVRVLKRAAPAAFFGTGLTLLGYGECLTKLGRYEEAESALLEAHRILAAALGSNDERMTKAIRSLTSLYESWGKPDKAAEWRAKLTETEEEPGFE